VDGLSSIVEKEQIDGVLARDVADLDFLRDQGVPSVLFFRRKFMV
jgi:hypothetical protein